MIKPIVAFGDPVLKAEAEEIIEGHSGLSKLIEDIWENMYNAEGVRLASPQVGGSI
ncbi:MAG: peptide deformylase, partial [Bacteroidetes bacterium]|nr:peptide deformylase [Bacteroidota bacterium]